MIYIAGLEALEEFLGENLRQFESGPAIAHPGIRLSHVGKRVAQDIRNGNTTAVRIACRVMTANPGMPFGKLIKSGFARALKQRVHLLSATQRLGLIAKTGELLELAFCPRETEDYCKLIQRFGQAELLPRMHAVRTRDSKSRVLLERLIVVGSL